MAAMRFASYDGTVLAYRELGSGAPLLCLPGGPGRAGEYLGDLGGLHRHRTLLVLDHRGTGGSQSSEDPSSYHAVRLVQDVEAFRQHLGLERVDLLTHSAAGNVGALYAARHPQRLGRMVLVTPGTAAVGIGLDDDEWFAAINRRSGEPWFAEALAAVTRINDGERTPELRAAAAPLFYGHWTEVEQAHAAEEERQVNWQVTASFRSAGSFGDPAHTRAALADVDLPVLVMGGERDPAPTPRMVAEFAALFPRGHAEVQPEAGHFPWLDDPKAFTEAVSSFLHDGDSARVPETVGEPG